MLVGRKVHHRSLGTGIVRQINPEKNAISVEFAGKTVKFVYPDAFKTFLTADDADTQCDLLEAIATKKTMQQKLVSQPPAALTAAKRSLSKEKHVIFKCNYCDGGASDHSIGYHGVCSEQIIRYNIETAKRRWCGSRDSDCAVFLRSRNLYGAKGKTGITYRELTDFVSEGGHVCYESQLLRDWRAFMGVDLDADKARKLPDYVRTNSLCVLTTRWPDSEERDRIVFAVFLAGSHFEGNDDDVGWVEAHPDFRLVLSPTQASKTLLWNYYANGKNPAHPRWGQGLTRKMEADNAVALLKDIAEIKKGTSDEAPALRFLEYFCALHHYDIENLPRATGALQLASRT